MNRRANGGEVRACGSALMGTTCDGISRFAGACIPLRLCIKNQGAALVLRSLGEAVSPAAAVAGSRRVSIFGRRAASTSTAKP